MRFTIVTSSFHLRGPRWRSFPELTIEIKDYAMMPVTGAVDGPGNSAGLLARINFLREEPGGRRKRLFVNDLNGPLYILDKDTKKATTYLDFNGLAGKPGIFHRLAIDNLLASGFISFEFDPDYAPQWQVLHDPPGRSLAAGIQPARQQEFPGLEHGGILRDTGDPHVRRDAARSGPHRMDRFRHLQCDFRRHCPRVDAPAVQRPHSPDGRPDFQPNGAAAETPTGA